MNKKLLNNTNDFFKQFENINLDNKYMCIYQETTNVKQKITEYIASLADEKRSMLLPFPEDNTNASIVIVNKESTDIIGLLPSNSIVPFDIFGFYVAIPAWFPGNEHYATPCNKNGVEREKQYSMFKSKLIKYDYFTDSDDADLEICNYFKNVFVPRMRAIVQPQIDYRSSLISNRKRWKSLRKKITIEMEKRGELNITWKNEFALFLLASKYFPDAEYQYKPEWLGLQSLDIFIPSRNTGIEYQGKQHYEPVDYFGGESGFQETKRRDARKKELCELNGVKLIEWPYTKKVEQNAFEALFDQPEENKAEIVDKHLTFKGNYLDAEELITIDTYVDKDCSKIFEKAVCIKDFNKAIKLIKYNIEQQEQKQYKEWIRYLANNCTIEEIEYFLRPVINEKWVEEYFLPEIAKENSFIKIFYSTNNINWIILNLAASIMKRGHEDEMIGWLSALVDRFVESNNEHIRKKENKWTRKSCIQMKMAKFPEIMCKAEIDFEYVIKFCEKMKLPLQPRKLYSRAIFFSGYYEGLICGDLGVYNYYSNRIAEYNLVYYKYGRAQLTYYILKERKDNETLVYVTKSEEGGLLQSVGNDKELEDIWRYVTNEKNK